MKSSCENGDDAPISRENAAGGENEENEEAGSYPKDLSYGVYDCEPSSVDPNGTIISGSDQKPRIVLMGLRRYARKLLFSNGNCSNSSSHGTYFMRECKPLYIKICLILMGFLGVGKVPFKRSYSIRCHPTKLFFSSPPTKLSKRTYQILRLYNFTYGTFQDKSISLILHLIPKTFLVDVEH